MQPRYSQLVLPKPHISWSQLSVWLTNKERYMREYFDDGKKLDTKYLRFGKNIAELIEQGLHKTLLPDLEVYDTPEYEIRCKVRGEIPCLSFLDSYNERETPTTPANVFREYKTGKIPWTKAKVQKHDQLVFYATALKAIGKPIPAYCDLDWIETIEIGGGEDFWRDAGKKIQVTGRIISFHREFDPREIERMEELIYRSAWQISDAYQDYLNDL
jgi:hypothetical protein